MQGSVLNNIAFTLIVSMSAKCLVIGSTFVFILLTLIFAFFLLGSKNDLPTLCNSYFPNRRVTTLSFASIPEVVCDLSTPWFALGDYNRPSLESFLQASKTDADQDLRLSGLAVVSRLANARQPLVDVSKSRIHKIALVTLKYDTAAFSCGDLALNAQNAGYSVVTYFGWGNCGPDGNVTKTHTQEGILIPIVFAENCANSSSSGYYYTDFSDFLKAADKTVVNIIGTEQRSDELNHMAEYLKRLYFWFLLGPIITLELLRRKKKLCCATTPLQVDEESAAGNEENALLVLRVDEDQEQNIQDITGEEIESELQPLIITIDTDTDITTFDHMGRIIVCLIIERSIRYLAVGLGYVLLTLAALPVGISSGGLSFFRFDEQERDRQANFWDKLLPDNPTEIFSQPHGISCMLTLWWPLFQIFCFFMYSRFSCVSTWTVSTNVSKLIRSDWFSSNMYLLVLCFVVPYCSFGQSSFLDMFSKFLYFMFYNVTCAVCNFLFIIILNKHRVVSRYVFYISVCMICAYVESDIVAVFYFILNSQGSLNNLKLTALRTVALGLTLTLSFSSSMHIIRKVMKPQESLFEGLGER